MKPPHRTQLITTAAGLQASLDVTSEKALLDSVWACCDQFWRRYHCLPKFVTIHGDLPADLTWRLKVWLSERNVYCAKHYGERDWLLTVPPEEWRVREENHA